jgi:tetratricopeptide (TPR) repeat protein
MRAFVSFLIACVWATAEDRAQEAHAWNDTGTALMLQGRHSEAERAYARAMRIAEEDPSNWQGLFVATQNLATVLLQHGASAPRAERLLRRALDVGISGWGTDAPELGRVLADLASALMEQGRLTEAEVYFQRALPKLQGDPVSIAAWHSNMGVLAYRQHRSSGAITHFLQSIEAWQGRPEAVRAQFNLGALYLELHRNTDAEAVLCQAVDAALASGYDKAGLGIILSHYALALRRNGKKDESRRAKEQSKAYVPSRDYTVHVSDLVK